jgi:hypothetical protein
MSERMQNKRKFTADDDLVALARILKYKKMRRFG